MKKSTRLSRVDGVTVYRLFYPQVPVIVCSRHAEIVSAMPANSIVPVSESPPLVALAVRRGLATNATVRAAKRLSINWLNMSRKDSVSIFRKLSSPMEKSASKDKLAANGIRYRQVRGVPIILCAEAQAVCRLLRILRTGDHDLFLGEVIEARASRDFTRDIYWRFEEYRPALYLGSNKQNPFATLAP